MRKPVIDFGQMLEDAVTRDNAEAAFDAHVSKCSVCEMYREQDGMPSLCGDGQMLLDAIPTNDHM